MTDPRHLVLVGVNYTPHRGTGDKNFWAALVPALARDLDRITVVSVRSVTVSREHLTIAGCEVETRYINPALRRPARNAGSNGRPGTRQGGSHRRVVGLIEKQLVVRRIASELSDVLRERPGQQVHLMDNFGPGNRLLARAATRLGASFSVTAIAYERRGRRSYDRFLKLSYASSGIRVIALSRELERRLTDLGVGRGSVTRIPWGVTLEPGHQLGDRRARRIKLGLPPDRPLILWTGFIQQVREPDFRKAYELATRACGQGIDATFVFAFKPETFRQEYAALDQPGGGRHVMSTPVDTFADLLAASDVLFSPIFDRDCIVAPPLTWIESMAAGLPVLTTDVPGAGELVENGRTGYLAKDDAELIAKLFTLRDEHAAMGEACRSKVAADYNLAAIRTAYLTYWFGEHS